MIFINTMHHKNIKIPNTRLSIEIDQTCEFVEGGSRVVYLIDNYAVKIPLHWKDKAKWKIWIKVPYDNSHQRGHAPIRGRESNIREAEIYRSVEHKKYYCPVLYSEDSGRILVMSRARPLTDVEWKSFTREDFIHRYYANGKNGNVELKHDSFGMLDGVVVAVDYG